MTYGSFGAAYRSFQYLHYRKCRLYYLIGTPLLAAICLLIRFTSEPKGAPPLLPTMFLMFWGAFSLRLVHDATLSDPRLPADSPFPVTFPKNYSTLPVPTNALAFGPPLCGLAVPLMLWFLYCFLDGWPLKLGVFPFLPYSGLLVPPLALLAFASGVNTNRWTIGRFQGLGCLISLATFTLIPLMLFSLVENIRLRSPLQIGKAPVSTMVILSLLLVAVAVGLTFRLAPESRHGVAVLPDAGKRKRRGPSRLLTKEFSDEKIRTPAEATAWVLDRNTGGMGCGMAVVIVGAIVLIRVLFASNRIDTPLGIADIRIGSATHQTFYILLIILAFSPTAGQVGQLTLMMPMVKDKDWVLRQWYAIRPIPSAQIAVASALQSARMIRRVVTVIAVAMGVWLLLPASDSVYQGPLGFLLLRHATIVGVLTVVFSAAGIFATLWGASLSNPLAYPWRWKALRTFGMAGGSLVAVPIIYWILIPIFQFQIPHGDYVQAPESIGAIFYDHLLDTTPYLGAWMIVRAVLLWLGYIKARASNLVPAKTMAAGFAMWTAAVTVFGVAFSLLLPDLFPSSTYFLFAATLLPLNRLLWPVLTIDAARHV